jgi:triacylglycerol lipase
LLVTLLLLLPHAPVLAIEFLLLAWFGDPRPTPRPRWPELVRAWAGEVCWGVCTFGWRQPFRADAIPDRLGPASEGKQGILLLHGFVCNRGIWNPWMRGLSLHDVPFVALSLEPAFGTIDSYAEPIDRAMTRLEAATGRPSLIVAHSMGGLAARHWLRRPGAAQRCAGVVTIGSPHHGTWLARFAFSRNGHQMRPASAWIASLNGMPAGASKDVPLVCYFSHCDNIVFPAATATLPGADNRHLPGVAHVSMLGSRQLFDDVVDMSRGRRRI